MMVHTPLRPAPQDAPRPKLDDTDVLTRAVASCRAEIIAWMDDIDDERTQPECVDFAVTTALARTSVTGLDGFRAAALLQIQFGYPADHDLVVLLKRVIERVPNALRDAERDWVLKTGMRAPAKPGDAIAWLSPDDEPREGFVDTVDQGRAMVYAQVGDIHNPDAVDAGDSDYVRVPAERIFANISQTRYDLEQPVLGARYTSEVVAQACVDAAADYAARTETPTPTPTPTPASSPSFSDKIIDFASLRPKPASADRGELPGRIADILPFTRPDPTSARAPSAPVIDTAKVVYLDRPRLKSCGTPPPVKLGVPPAGGAPVNYLKTVLDKAFQAGRPGVTARPAVRVNLNDYPEGGGDAA
jgi:hypothetical protein